MTNVKEEIIAVKLAFKKLEDKCEHKESQDTDCHHPEQDFNCVTCSVCNCPYLFVDLEGMQC